MIRYSCVIMLLCATGCAGSSPDPQEVLETSRTTTAQVEKNLEAIQKSTDEIKLKIDDLKQKPPAQRLHTEPQASAPDNGS